MVTKSKKSYKKKPMKPPIAIKVKPSGRGTRPRMLTFQTLCKKSSEIIQSTEVSVKSHHKKISDSIEKLKSAHKKIFDIINTYSSNEKSTVMKQMKTASDSLTRISEHIEGFVKSVESCVKASKPIANERIDSFISYMNSMSHMSV